MQIRAVDTTDGDSERDFEGSVTHKNYIAKIPNCFHFITFVSTCGIMMQNDVYGFFINLTVVVLYSELEK